jgi:fructose-1,6-bisphosphatase/inositol monophosphatase family enzyme
VALRDAVAAVIRAAAETEILPRWRNLADHEIAEKGRPGDLVTAADTEAEAFLARELTALLPRAAVVGEEGAEVDPSVLDALGEEPPVWVLDPVDGTRNFARGTACFSVIVALVEGGETLAGWIHAPVEDETVWAAPGCGAWRRTGQGDWARLAPIAPGGPARSLRGSVSPRLREGLGAWPGGLVRYYCVGREYMELAAGDLQFGVYGGLLKPWDHAAGVLIHAEAGGFAALTAEDTGGGVPYRPLRIVKNDRLLLAPDEKSWQSLRSILAGG